MIHGTLLVGCGKGTKPSSSLGQMMASSGIFPSRSLAWSVVTWYPRPFLWWIRGWCRGRRVPTRNDLGPGAHQGRILQGTSRRGRGRGIWWLALLYSQLSTNVSSSTVVVHRIRKVHRIRIPSLGLIVQADGPCEYIHRLRRWLNHIASGIHKGQYRLNGVTYIQIAKVLKAIIRRIRVQWWGGGLP